MVEEKDFGAEFDNPNGVITITTSGDAQMVIIQTTYGCDFGTTAEATPTDMMKQLHEGTLDEAGKQALFASVFTTRKPGEAEEKMAA